MTNTFRAVLEAGGPSFMPTQVVQVPAHAWQAVGGKATKRVVATLNGHAERLGLLPQEGGGRYLLLRKELCQRLGLAVGQELEVSLTPDPNPDYVDLPDELAEALAAWPEAETAFQAQTGAMRRAMARKVADAKRPDTRARYAVELAERLARGGHPFRATS
ncbi:YdeI/OmpD-associated family protein [Hymenobacter cheonanensis]|uniref:YdeI/OmpD-associated family protein n=1 Tax=Hymenobacter sp. CA2-7 TaxID=3063993 RepID=UPI00271298EC|nr:YdeI/OmpD-associated family protein [Hymenobacter sp. CA2-7]MDO7886061.1 YdeI/OmpD-associated family protein [Hymenobacter sp. CA2-7]